ncbi:hypothetical protein [Pandoraea anhela]|uniref:DUF2157 domain-containing protein n=1 Tax=Pandoraea anhela TaxID=2508295 RepID=A0A5E4XN03_9BURK|nr:hypothetical protein [Pandoraea anhela]VVE37861.1 hypothetical protein PAN31108_03982 [Pandoraea anhela]
MTTSDLQTPPQGEPAEVPSPASQQRIDDEPLRLVTSFNDVFVVIAAWLMTFGAVMMTRALPSWTQMMLAGALAWGLSEIFVRRRRMALPALLFSAIFVSNSALLGIGNASLFHDNEQALRGALNGWTLVATCLLPALGAALYWWRFRVPAVIAMGIFAVVVAVWVHVLTLNPQATGWLMIGNIVAGLIVFAWALRWDAQDPQRTTLRSDVAFWLHLLAATMVTHPIFSMLMPNHPLIVMMAFLVLTLVSLIVDRRALMLSSVIYLLNAILRMLVGAVQEPSEFDTGFSGYLPVAAFTVGGVLLLLSGFWHVSRKGVLRALPASWRARLPR